jgi:hypothetical protein
VLRRTAFTLPPDTTSAAAAASFSATNALACSAALSFACADATACAITTCPVAALATDTGNPPAAANPVPAATVAVATGTAFTELGFH